MGFGDTPRRAQVRRPSRGKVLRVSAVGEEKPASCGDGRGRRDAAVLHDAKRKCELAFLADAAPRLGVLKPRLREEGKRAVMRAMQ